MNNIRVFLVWLLIGLLAMAFYQYVVEPNQSNVRTKSIYYRELLQEARNGNVIDLTFGGATLRLVATLRDNHQIIAQMPYTPEVLDELRKAGLNIDDTLPPPPR